MGVIAIVVDGVGLMIGSLMAASLLTCAAWWLGEWAHRPWVALAVLPAIVIGMLASPLESSLFVRMVSVFGMVGAALLWWVGRDGDDGATRTDR